MNSTTTFMNPSNNIHEFCHNIQGIRVPGLMHVPWLISSNKNVSTPATTADFMPTILSILEVKSDNPTWVMDGIDLMPLVSASATTSSGLSTAVDKATGYMPRPKKLGFDSTGGQHAIIDNNWKLLHNPGGGQCDFQPPYGALPSPATKYP
jgi:arylsulfatase A-like enzyme